MMEKVHSNLTEMCTWADFQPNSRFVLRENRELIHQNDLERFLAQHREADYLAYIVSTLYQSLSLGVDNTGGAQKTQYLSHARTSKIGQTSLDQRGRGTIHRGYSEIRREK